MNDRTTYEPKVVLDCEDVKGSPKEVVMRKAFRIYNSEHNSEMEISENLDGTYTISVKDGCEEEVLDEIDYEELEFLYEAIRVFIKDRTVS